MSYDDASRLATLTQGTQAASYTYEGSLGVIEQVKVKISGTERYRLSRVHDRLGRVTRIDTHGNETTLYTQRDSPGAVDVRGNAPEQVGVIVNGERTQRTDGDFYAPATGDNSAGSLELDIVVKALDPGPPELLAEESRTALLPQDPESFTYDLDGNLTQDGLWTYEWDADEVRSTKMAKPRRGEEHWVPYGQGDEQNRLIALESRTDLPATVVRQRLEFAYDSRSRRIEKTVAIWDEFSDLWSQTSSFHYLYDGWNLLAEYDALNSDTLLRSHTWGLDLSGTPQGAGGVGGLLWTTQATNAYAPGFDANGNIIAWVDLSDGILAGTNEYGAFGETLVQSGMIENLPFGFSTKYEDAETSLLYYGYRYYSPNLGRWPSRDPMGEYGGANLYGFSNNNGVDNWDLLGMFFSSCSLISGPTVKQGAEWELKEVAPDIIGGTQGSFLYGFDVTWEIEGEVECCCKTLGLFNERVETKSVQKTYEEATQLPDGGFPVYSPLNLPSGVPSAKTIGDAVNQLVASRLTIGTSFLLNPALEGAQINGTVMRSKPRSVDAGEWPKNPCD
jgi:RHS repeat-associated protein